MIGTRMTRIERMNTDLFFVPKNYRSINKFIIRDNPPHNLPWPGVITSHYAVVGDNTKPRLELRTQNSQLRILPIPINPVPWPAVITSHYAVVGDNTKPRRNSHLLPIPINPVPWPGVITSHYAVVGDNTKPRRN
ncbi:MAG: hypothetical protein ABI402_19510, partial [Ferruginibacter sp.]